MPTRKDRGYTLSEMLITLSLLAIITATALPALSDWFHGEATRSAARRIFLLIQYSRSEAISRRQPVVICGSDNATECSFDWSAGTLVFTDTNDNRKIDSHEQLLRYETPLLDTGSIQWNAAYNARFFRALPSGSVSYTGNFLFCPEDADSTYATSVIINNTGRPRFADDHNDDGIAENSSGQPLEC